MKKYLQNFLEQLRGNWKSGLVVAIVTIPLSISLAIASGATPVQGLITAIWASLIASLFASSQFNIFGPAGALTGILLSASMLYGPQYLPIIAVFSGIFMLCIYAFKLTRYITLIPAAGLQGFLFAVGIVIFVGQIPSGLGLNDLQLSSKVYLSLIEIFKHINQIDWFSFTFFGLGLGFLFLLKKIAPKIPGAIVLSIIGIGLGYLSFHGMIPKIYLLVDKYPNLAFSLFQNTNPFETYKQLFSNPAQLFSILKMSLIITIITILETIISGKLAEKKSGLKFNKNKEVLGNGLANIGSGLCGGFPATAVFIRTSLNMQNGAKSKFSGFLAGIFALLISLLLFNSAFKYLPMPIIAAILSSIAIGIMDFDILKKFYKFNKTSFYIILITIFFSIVEDTVVGILIGTAIALLVFLKRVTNGDLNVNVFRKRAFFMKTSLPNYLQKQEKDDIVIVKFTGEINYLNIDSYIEQLEQIHACKTIIFSFSQLSDIDIDGIEILETVLTHFKEKKNDIYITGMNNKGIQNILMKLDIVKQLEKEQRIISSSSELLQNII